jgi:DNA-binding MarR family transcriptional regulator
MKDEILEENQSEEKSTLASISKRVYAMRILKHIFEDTEGFGAYFHKELADALKIHESTTYMNLNKLVEVGLLDKTEPKGNRKEKYYSVADRNLAEKAIQKYERWLGFCLARLIPHEKQYVSQLRQNKRFIEACEYYGVSVAEGITAILRCYKIGKMQDASETVVWREK